MEQKVTLQQLAEKLNGKYWEKGTIKRIYLDKGYNTKKMTTKTFIWEDDGEFQVSCRISCNSQPYEWIKSQQDEIKERVVKEIENALATEVLLLQNKEGQFIDSFGEPCNLNNVEFFYNEDDFNEEVENNIRLFGAVFVKMDRFKFETEVARLDDEDTNSKG